MALTCAEIGIEPEEVEENLNLWLPMGEAWGAIMLLDEADLYLEQRVRGLDSLRHNGMVSSKIFAHIISVIIRYLPI